MEMIQGAEWVVVAIFLTATLAGLFLVVSAQGDMNLREETGENDDDQAAAMLIDLICKTRNSLVIHDDGNDSDESVYNNDQVVAAVRDRIRQRRRLKVKCLFNDRERLKLLELADGECKGNISVWYASGDRPKKRHPLQDRGWRAPRTPVRTRTRSERKGLCVTQGGAVVGRSDPSPDQQVVPGSFRTQLTWG